MARKNFRKIERVERRRKTVIFRVAKGQTISEIKAGVNTFWLETGLPLVAPMSLHDHALNGMGVSNAQEIGTEASTLQRPNIPFFGREIKVLHAWFCRLDKELNENEKVHKDQFNFFDTCLLEL